MKNSNLILLIAAIVIIVAYYTVRRYREKYTYRKSVLDKFRDMKEVHFSTYDGIGRNVRVKVLGEVITIESMDTETNTPSYVTVINNAIDTTPTETPEGEYLFNVVDALNGDKDMYSLLLGDTTLALYLDVTNDAMGTIDIKGLKDLSAIKEPKSLNFSFTPV
jgi:hypothetical protein